MKVLVEDICKTRTFITGASWKFCLARGHELTVKKMLSQPGQFACEEKVEVVGTKGSQRNVCSGSCKKRYTGRGFSY